MANPVIQYVLYDFSPLSYRIDSVWLNIFCDICYRWISISMLVIKSQLSFIKNLQQGYILHYILNPYKKLKIWIYLPNDFLMHDKEWEWSAYVNEVPF